MCTINDYVETVCVCVCVCVYVNIVELCQKMSYIFAALNVFYRITFAPMSHPMFLIAVSALCFYILIFYLTCVKHGRPCGIRSKNRLSSKRFFFFDFGRILFFSSFYIQDISSMLKFVFFFCLIQSFSSQQMPIFYLSNVCTNFFEFLYSTGKIV